MLMADQSVTGPIGTADSTTAPLQYRGMSGPGTFETTMLKANGLHADSWMRPARRVRVCAARGGTRSLSWTSEPSPASSWRRLAVFMTRVTAASRVVGSLMSVPKVVYSADVWLP